MDKNKYVIMEAESGNKLAEFYNVNELSLFIKYYFKEHEPTSEGTYAITVVTL